MISRKWSKYINSLQIKKYRQEHQAFLVEGRKSVLELLDSSLETEIVFCSDRFFQENSSKLNNLNIEICSEDELTKAGSFDNNNAAIAIVKIPFQSTDIQIPKNESVLMLDCIRDPGNLGTIIRTADWYGISTIICSNDTTDIYSPKVVASTMGSFSRINVYYTNLSEFLDSNTNYEVYGAFLEGTNIHHLKLTNPATKFIVIGNESNGISESASKFITQKIHIPGAGKTESLNAGIATAIILDNFYRELNQK